MRRRSSSQPSLLTTTVVAQWLNYPTPGVPRLPDGKPDLSAPAPRTADGKPDLSGIWSGAGPSYRFNIAQDLETKDIQPWAEALFIKRVRDARMDSPLSKCLPVSVPYHNFFNLTRIVQTPALVVMLYESANVPPRTVFTDGRDLPKDPNPTWFGYSIGRWEGDTLVITSAGFNDQGWLDSSGHPQTESLRLTERLRRRDFGHMDYEITVDDPKVFTRPFTIKRERLLSPDTQLLEDVCENERSRARMSGDTGVRLRPEQVAPLAGVYEIAPGREFTITVTEDLVFVRGLNEPRVPLLVQSETRFMSTTTPIGLEFFKDARGTVTHVHRARRCGRGTEGRSGRTLRHRRSDRSDHRRRADRRGGGHARGADRPSPLRGSGEASVPASPLTADSYAALEKRCGTPKAVSPESIAALRRARWVPFLHLDQAHRAKRRRSHRRNDSAPRRAASPTRFNLFVFVDGAIRGHGVADADDAGARRRGRRRSHHRR